MYKREWQKSDGKCEQSRGKTRLGVCICCQSGSYVQYRIPCVRVGTSPPCCSLVKKQLEKSAVNLKLASHNRSWLS